MRLAERQGLLAARGLFAFQTERSLCGASHFVAVGIEQALLHRAGRWLQRMVVHLGLYRDHRLVVGFLQVGIDKRAEGSHADSRRFHQPGIAVDAGTLVEPALLERGVGPHTDQVVAAIVHIFRHVVHLCGIAAGLGAHIEAVEPHAGIAEDAVEPQGDVLAQVALGNADGVAIPAHARRGIFKAYGLVAM